MRQTMGQPVGLLLTAVSATCSRPGAISAQSTAVVGSCLRYGVGGIFLAFAWVPPPFLFSRSHHHRASCVSQIFTCEPADLENALRAC